MPPESKYTSEFEKNAVIIRFSIGSPFWPFSFAYGIIYEPNKKMWFPSLDHYIGFHMLCREEDQQQVLKSPNSWIAHQNLTRILKESYSYGDNPVIDPQWEENKNNIMLRAERLRFSQHSALQRMILRTNDRAILDDSRIDPEGYWFYCGGRGQNQHGKILEQVRQELRSNTLFHHLHTT